MSICPGDVPSIFWPFNELRLSDRLGSREPLYYSLKGYHFTASDKVWFVSQLNHDLKGCTDMIGLLSNNQFINRYDINPLRAKRWKRICARGRIVHDSFHAGRPPTLDEEGLRVLRDQISAGMPTKKGGPPVKSNRPLDSEVFFMILKGKIETKKRRGIWVSGELEDEVLDTKTFKKLKKV